MRRDIDAKDMRPMKASELKLGGMFYWKDDSGKFHSAQIYEDEVKNKSRADALRNWVEKLAREGKLFVRTSAPFKSFV